MTLNMTQNRGPRKSTESAPTRAIRRAKTMPLGESNIKKGPAAKRVHQQP